MDAESAIGNLFSSNKGLGIKSCLHKKEINIESCLRQKEIN